MGVGVGGVEGGRRLRRWRGGRCCCWPPPRHHARVLRLPVLLVAACRGGRLRGLLLLRVGLARAEPDLLVWGRGDERVVSGRPSDALSPPPRRRFARASSLCSSFSLARSPSSDAMAGARRLDLSRGPRRAIGGARRRQARVTEGRPPKSGSRRGVRECAPFSLSPLLPQIARRHARAWPPRTARQTPKDAACTAA